MARGYDNSVFINCPFDSAYRPLFEAVAFAVYDCGFYPRSALEIDDSSEVRIDKIQKIIRQSRLAVHDISRTQLDRGTRLPRFNMPLELGIFLGAKTFGTGDQRRKAAIVLDTDRFRYQKYISDIAGQDIRAHGGKPPEAFARCGTSSPRTVRPAPSSPGATRSWSATRASAGAYPTPAGRCTWIRSSSPSET